MCPADVIVKTENIDGVIGRSSPVCGDNVGAVTEKRDVQRPSALPSPPPTPSKLRIKREDPDDILTDLHYLFDGLSMDDSDDESDSGSDTAPPSPRSKGGDFFTKSCFFVGTTVYSFDEERNVYLEAANGNSLLVHGSETSDSLLDMLNTFNIKEIMFQFDIAGSLYYYNEGSWCLVPTWQQPSLDLHPYDRGLGTDYNGNEFNETLQPSQSFETSYDFQQFGQPSVTTGSFPDTAQSQPQTKKEVEEYSKSNPLNHSLQGSIALPWSPSSSSQSPIVSSTSRATSESYEHPLIQPTFKAELPLFPSQPEVEAEEELGWMAGMHLWQRESWKQETRQIQAARHAPAIDKMDRRRCPECSKVFRRPSSLEDHLNVHSGNKPHVCPYERCKTGFATKSNMKRHFTTHRAGTLEEYSKSGKVNNAKSLTATYNAKAFHTQRFRLT